MSNGTYLNKHTARSTASHTFIRRLSQCQKHLYTIISPGLKPLFLWHRLQTNVATSSSDSHGSPWSGRYTSSIQASRHTWMRTTHATWHYRPRKTTATSGRLEWQTQRTCVVGREREGECSEFPGKLLDWLIAAQDQGEINLWGARGNIQTGNSNTRSARQKETGRRDKMTK